MIFSQIVKKLSFYAKGGKNHSSADPGEAPDSPEQKEPASGAVLSGSLRDDLALFRELFRDSGDIIFRELSPGPGAAELALIYADGLANSLLITESLVKPLLSSELFSGGRPPSADEIGKAALCSGEVSRSRLVRELARIVLSGDTLILAEGCKYGFTANTKGFERRSVTEPQSESVVRGPREGFTESIRTNTSLLRRKIQVPELRMEQMMIGRQTKTCICISYIHGIASPEVLKKLRYRLSAIEIDSVLDSGYIEQYIEDSPFSPFPTVGYSEKPDVVAGKLLEGRVAIIVDGSPFVLTVPYLFTEGFQSSEDYYARTLYSSAARFLRHVAFFLTVFGPSIYVALTTFHQELIPTVLLYTIAGAREGTPFPAFLEALILLFAFELLREAGIRLPRPVGQAISIVGALVMGDAAVSAGLVGAPMVIAIAITAVAGFAIPTMNDSIALLRVFFLTVTAVLGGYGLVVSLIAMLIHLSTLKSFGVPYNEGFSDPGSVLDGFFRAPLWMMVFRPRSIASGNLRRRIKVDPPAVPKGERE